MSAPGGSEEAGKNRMTLAALVRGQRSRHRSAAADGSARASRPGRRPTDDSAERTTDPRSEPSPSEEVQASRAVFQRMVAAMHGVLRSVRSRTAFPVSTLAMPLGAMLESLRSSDSLLLPFFDPGGAASGTAEQAVNICALSLKIAAEFDHGPGGLMKLGLTALLHGGGVARSSRDETRLVQGLTTAYPGVSEALVLLAEREGKTDTSPEVGETELGEHVHIVELAGLIETRVRRRPALSGLGHSEAIKEILKHERGTYPDKILKVAIRVLATLPVGSLVRLNTGEICRVTAKNEGFPLRPVVQVLVRQRARVPEPTTVDLSKNPFLRVDGFVTEETIDREVEGSAP